MARVYPYDDSPDALFRPAKGLEPEDFFQSWSAEDVAEPHLLCAEMSRLAYANEAVVTAALPIAKFTLVSWLGGPRLAARFAAWGADGFVATDGNRRTVVAFRGTESDKIEDLLVDLLTRPRAWTGGGEVHEGFQAALSHVQSAVDSALGGISPQGELLITGHSLGAGLATLLAAQLRVRHPRLITFGSPRVGDARFASLIDATSVARIVNCCDVVTRIPPEAFDARHIDELLAELGVPSLLSHGLAAVLSLLLGAGGLSAHFEHVAPPLYVNGAGTVDSQITDSGMIKDRTSARERYRQSHPVAAMDWDAVLAAVRHLTELVGRKQPLRQAVGQQGASLSFLKIGSQVPLRDLSDHAPVNYVSAMVRSFQSAGAKPGPPRPSSTGSG